MMICRVRLQVTVVFEKNMSTDLKEMRQAQQQKQTNSRREDIEKGKLQREGESKERERDREERERGIQQHREYKTIGNSLI